MTIPHSKILLEIFPLWLRLLILCALLFIPASFYYLNTKTSQISSNNCLNQNIDKDPQELVKDIIIEFEEAQIGGDERSLANCISPSLDLSFLRAPTNRGLGCYTECMDPPYEIMYVGKSGSDAYIAGVQEHRKFYSPGIGGGSYPEATVPAKFVVKKMSDRWLITDYKTQVSYSYGIFH